MCYPHKIPVIRGYLLLSVAACQGIQEHTLALGSLAVSPGISTNLKSEIPFPQNTVNKAKGMEAWIHGYGLVEDGMQEQCSICGAVYPLQS